MTMRAWWLNAGDSHENCTLRSGLDSDDFDPTEAAEGLVWTCLDDGEEIRKTNLVAVRWDDSEGFDSPVIDVFSVAISKDGATVKGVLSVRDDGSVRDEIERGSLSIEAST